MGGFLYYELHRNSFGLFWLTFIAWIAVMLAELNRSPFDLVERESELVRIFKVQIYFAVSSGVHKHLTDKIHHCPYVFRRESNCAKDKSRVFKTLCSKYGASPKIHRSDCTNLKNIPSFYYFSLNSVHEAHSLVCCRLYKPASLLLVKESVFQQKK